MITVLEIEIISIVFAILFTLWFVRIFIETLKGYLEIQAITKENIPAVKLINIQHSQENPITNFLYCIFATGMSGYVCYYIINYWFDIYCLIAFSLLFIVSLIDFPRKYLIYKYGEFVFLTQTSLATIDKIYKKDNYRFLIENKATKTGDTDAYLNVYKRNTIQTTQPVCFKIVENTEEVIRIINEYY